MMEQCNILLYPSNSYISQIVRFQKEKIDNRQIIIDREREIFQVNVISKTFGSSYEQNIKNSTTELPKEYSSFKGQDIEDTLSFQTTTMQFFRSALCKMQPRILS